ncbi:MAG: hypothetical protein U5Q44_08690 [Dehalococcoidia bacterium]|nr:hypothetical protein [Dehalococcoidia bacterium]
MPGKATAPDCPRRTNHLPRESSGAGGFQPAPAAGTLDLTWNASTGEYLAVWSEHPDHSSTSDGEVHNGDDRIFARYFFSPTVLRPLVRRSKCPEGGDSKDFPAVAHTRKRKDPNQGNNNRPSLVVWTDTRDGPIDVWSQVIRSPSGSGL